MTEGENVSFLEYDQKPRLSQMEEYFDGRLTTEGKGGLTISRDFLGNSVYSSLSKTEETLAGRVPATLIVSDDGRDVILNNPGLLSDIAQGTIKTTHKNSLGGNESHVYTLHLNTKTGNQPFALKYTFPIEGNFTSGIVAMRIMQEAQKEQPLPGLTYITPVLATHDMTLAPLYHHGLPITHFLAAVNANTSHDLYNHVVQEYQLPDSVLPLLCEIKSYETTMGEYRSFSKEFTKGMRAETQKLVQWVKNKIQQNQELKDFHYSSIDTSLYQSVVSVEKAHELLQEFQHNTSLNSINSSFREGVLKSLALVEMGIATVQ